MPSIARFFRRNSLAAVAALFLVVFAVFEALIWGVFATGRLYPLMASTASITSVLVAWAHIPVTLSGIQLVLPSRILEIDVDCTAIQLAALYAALVIAYPVAPKTKLIGLMVGLPLIFVANLLRLLGVALASEHLSQNLFSFTHDFLFKVVMMFVVIGLWGWWLQTARNHARAS